jgi:hypothetical protein
VIKLLSGLVIGLVLGVAATSYAASVIGDAYLTGWTVTKDGDEICTDPYVWRGTREIECDGVCSAIILGGYRARTMS